MRINCPIPHNRPTFLPSFRFDAKSKAADFYLQHSNAIARVKEAICMRSSDAQKAALVTSLEQLAHVVKQAEDCADKAILSAGPEPSPEVLAGC